MKITQEEVVDRQTVLNIELEEDDISPYLDQGYRRIVQRANIPGFRKGKAPRQIIEQFFGREALIQESLDRLLPDVTDKAIEEQELDAIGIPKVELTEVEPLTLKATVPLTPEIDLGTYTDIRVEEEEAEVTDDEVDERIEEMRKSQTSWEPVERPVKLGDMVTLEVTGSIDGDSILDEKDAVFVTEAESPNPFPGFSEELEGIEPEASKEFDIQVADDHPDERFASKQVNFNVTVNDIKEQKLPELDDDFAKGLGDEHETLEALKESVNEDLSATAELRRAAQYRDSVLEELLKTVSIDLPPLVVDHEVEHMIERRDAMIDQLNMTKDDYFRYTEKTDEQSITDARENAVDHFTRVFGLAKLAETEALEVSEEEIDERVAEIEKSETEEAQDLKKRGLNSDGVRSSIRDTLLNGKAMDRLVDIAKGKANNVGEESEDSAEIEDQEDSSSQQGDGDADES